MRVYRWYLFLAGLTLVMGCQTSHQTQKQQALDRWNHARARVNLNLARQQFEMGELDKAVTTAEGVVAMGLPWPEADLLLGRIYLEQNRLGLAQKSFERCLAVDPLHAEANFNLGIVQEKWRQPERALEYYQLACAAQPDRVGFVLAVAEVMAGQQRYEDALAAVRNYMKIGPPSGAIYMAAGEFLLRLERPLEAIDMFEKARAMEPDDAGIVEALAFAYHQRGDSSKALMLFKEITRQTELAGKEPSWAVMLAMGDCYLSLGELHAAQRCFEYVSERNISDAGVWTRLAQVALERGDVMRARLHATRAVTLQEGCLDAYMVLGYAALKAADYAEAQQMFGRIVEAGRRESLVYCLWGRSLEATGQLDRARDCYAQALQLNPNDPLAQRLLHSAGELSMIPPPSGGVDVVQVQTELLR